MPGDAGSAIIKIKTSIDWGDLSSLESKIDALEKTTHTIKVKVEAAEGQKGLDKYLKDIDKLGQDAFRKTSGGAKNASKDIQNVGSGAKDVADNFKKAGKSANVLSASSKRIKKDSDEYVTALKAANHTVDDMKKNLSKMQDARLGDAKSRKEFENYNKQLKEMVALRDKLGDPHGNQTNNSFNRNFNAITGSADRSLQEIKKNGEYTNEVANQMIEGHEAVTKAAEQRAKSEAKIEADRVRNLQRQEEAERKAYEAQGIREVKEQARQEAAAQKEAERAAKVAQKEAEAKAKADADYNRLLKDTPELDFKAQQNILSRRAQIANEINKWTAAARGGTSVDYKALQDAATALEALEFERKGGSLSNGEYAKRFREISAAALEAETNIQKAGKNTLSFGDKFKNAFSELSRYITPAMALREGVQAVRQMVQASMDIESAMTRIQIVTGSTDTQMSQFFETASSQAQELGKGITDVAGSIETFSRLGYDLDEATNLSKFANIMANVGDVSVDEATTGITSIIKGFELKASDAEHVSDVLVEVGQKYAISASELMQAFERGGASLHASGASFEESAALFAATNAALQNAAKTGTMWNTVAARMRSSKTELAEMGESYEDLAGGFSKYRDEVLQLSGIDIMRSSGEFKNPYEIMTELAQAWDNVNGEPAKARLAEIFAGTRQLSGFMSTIINIKDAMNAYSDAIDAAGVSTEANNLYMETTAAHVEQLKAAFQELSYDTFNGDLMKVFVDFGKGSLNVIDTIIDKIGLLGTVLSAVAIGKQIKSFAGDMKEGFSALQSAQGLLKPGNLAFLGVTAGITAAIAAYQQYQKVQQQQNQEAMAAADTFQERSKALTEYADRVHELRTQLASGELSESEALGAKKELLDIQNQLNESYQNGAENLNLLTGQIDQQTEAVRALNQENAIDFLTRQGGKNGGLDDAIAAMESGVGEKVPFSAKYNDAFLGSFSGYTEAGKKVLDLAESYGELFDIVRPYGNDGEINLYFKGNAEEAQTTLRDFTKDVRNLAEVGESDVVDTVFNQSTKALNNADAILDTYKKIYDTYKESQLITDDKDYSFTALGSEKDTRKAIDWINDYRKAVENYNDALLSGDTEKIAEAQNSFEYIDKAVTALLGLGGKFSNYSNMVQEIRDQLQETMVETNDLMDTLTNTPESAQGDFFQRSIDRAKSLNMTADDLRNNIFDIENGLMSGNPHQRSPMLQAVQDLLTSMSMLEDVDIYDESGNIKVDVVTAALEQMGVFAQQTADQVEEAIPTLESFSDYQSILTSALNASASATGLTTEQITGLTEAYQGIEGFDPNRLFETTTNGIHLNAKELNNLNKILENTKMKKFAEDIKDAQDELDKLTDEYGEDSKQAKAAQKRLDDLRREEAQYEGLTSAYNKWQQAQSQTDERASYESVGKGFDTVGNLIEHGWINDAEVGTFLDLVLGKVDAIGNVAKRSGDNLKDFESLSQNIVGGISGTDYGVSVKDLWTYGEDGGLTPGGIQQMLKLANQFDSSIVSMQETADGTSVKINLMGDNMNRLSQELGLSAEMIQLFERAALDAGADMILDSTNLGLMTDQVKTLTQNNEALAQTLSGFDWSNVENWDSDEVQRAIEALDEGIKQVGDDTEEARNQADLMRTTIESLQMQQVRTEVNAQISSGKSYDDLLNMSDEEIQATFHVEADGVDEVRSQIEELKAEAESTSITVSLEEGQFNELTGGGEETEKTATVRFEKDTSEIDGYEPGEKSATVRYGKDTSLPDSWQPQDKTATATYNLVAPSPPSYPNMSRTVTYTIRTIGSKPSLASGTMLSVAHADGSMANGPWNWHAYAGGNIALPEDEMALVNELGTESVIRNGQWMLLPGGMHTEALKKGDIILSASQTKSLLTSGKALGHGHAYALGTVIANAYAGGDRGTWNWNKDWTSSASSSSNSGGGSKGSGGSSGSGNNSNDNNSDDELEIFDWIELAIDRIERAIKQLGITAKSTFKTLTTRLEANATEIKTVTDEIELQQKAYDRYIQQANSVGLSEDLAQRVRDGAIDINEYDKETQELIDDYQKWYEKALDCSDAIQQLHEDLGQLYEDRFNDTKDDFDAQLALLEHLTTTYENGMDNIEARGYLMTTKYYEAMRDVEKQNIDLMHKELDELTEKMSQAVNSGEIKEGSQSWYEMQQSINEVKEAIQEAETSVIDLGNSIREVLWDRFDYLQDRITEITDESQFLIDLMEHSDLFTEEGQLTNTGMATMGLHGQNYNILMNQADRYAAEIKKLNKDIANDPNNTKLLEQRQEWLEAQRESILNAEDEKDAIVDLVEEGIQKELSYLNDLIDKYKESLDTAKSLYDYQKKVKEQADNITRIQKQLSAYSGDNSEEARSTIQKLNVDLSDATEKLQETQYQRQISDQKEMLSNLYDQYDLILNQRLDNVDALISDMINMINDNAGSISNTISTEARDVGYTLSEAMRSIWTTDGKVSSVITLYGDNFVKFGETFNGTLTTVNDTISRIAKYTAKIAGVSDEEAKTTVKNTTATTKTNTTAKPVTPAPTPQKKVAETKKADKTDQEKYGVAIAIWNGLQGWGGGDDRKKKLEAKGFNYNEIQGIVSKIKGDILSGAWNGKYYGITYKDIPNYAYNKFKSGGLVDYTGIAQVDGTPGKPESFLSAKDTKNFMLLRDVLRDITSGKASFSGSAANLGLFSGLSKVHLPQSQKGLGFGDVTYQINIPIDHVSDYNDLVNKMRTDTKFQNLIQSMTIGQISGQGSLSKNRYKW